MESIIDALVRRFERGGLTRRQLIPGLSTLLAATGASRADAAQAGGLRGTGIDHLSILVNGLQRSSTFYQTAVPFSRVQRGGT